MVCAKERKELGEKREQRGKKVWRRKIERGVGKKRGAWEKREE